MLMALLHYAKPPTIEPCSSDSKSAEVIKAPADAPEVLAVYDYLKACNYIFERGILQRFRLWRLDHPVLERIEEGFNYFAFWIDAIESIISFIYIF